MDERREVAVRGWRERQGKKREQRENKAGYTATSCRRVGRSGNARLPTFRTDQPTD